MLTHAAGLYCYFFCCAHDYWIQHHVFIILFLFILLNFDPSEQVNTNKVIWNHHT